MSATLLLEIGCEEIPARMIVSAAADFGARVVAVLDQAGIARGEFSAWGGSRRLAVRVEAVAARQAGRDELVLGPPASAAFGPDGAPTGAAAGFARKQGIDPSELRRVETEKGVYAGFRRVAAGKSLADILAAAFPGAVGGMSFPKTMRWGAGIHRWVRPVHWLVALHGGEVLPLELFGTRAGRASDGHRFLRPGPVDIPTASDYAPALAAAFVVVDPAERRLVLRERLAREAAALGGALVEDPDLLDEVVELVEWPGVVAGRFDAAFLDLPAEILVTTLRHHQKAFSVRGPAGLIPAFLAVANTDRDPSGHIRRGNEWVVSGRLEDARFFWNEERKRPLHERLVDLEKVVFHVKAGSYAEKSRALADLAEGLADRISLPAEDRAAAVDAARLAKADLVTGLVGEFPELQGIVGGLLLEAEGGDRLTARAVYEHYRPTGADDALPSTAPGCLVSLADKVHTAAALVAAGETPTGSRDPFGLRRAVAGVFRIVEARRWPASIDDLARVSGGHPDFLRFLQERYTNYLRDKGYTSNEIAAVLRPRVSAAESLSWSLSEIAARLAIVKTLRGRPDFEKLVELTKRVDNILEKAPGVMDVALDAEADLRGWEDGQASAMTLKDAHERLAPRIAAASGAGRYDEVVNLVAEFAAPVSKFFDDVLVLDPKDPDATRRRCNLLGRVRSTVTRDFDIRELAGQADRRS